MTEAERIELTRQALLAACREACMFVTGDGRVTESDAETLLGISTLSDMRRAGTGPAVYQVPLNGKRWCYRLDDLAIWIEIGRTCGRTSPKVV